MAHRLDRVLRMLANEPWAITPDALRVLVDVVDRRLQGLAVSDTVLQEIEAARAARAGGLDIQGGIAVLPVFGVISHRINMLTEVSGGTSIDRFRARFREAVANPDVSTVVLDIDSPGGGIGGVMEMAAEIRASSKRVVAVANDLAASAAYWLASAADEIVVTPSGMIGSVGVFSAHTEFSRLDENLGVTTTLVSAGEGKVDGNNVEPLSDRARDRMQAVVDGYYEMFVTAVVEGRNAAGQHITGATVRDRYKADVYMAEEAVAIGMADRVATMDETLSTVVGRRGGARAEAAADETRVRRARRLAGGYGSVSVCLGLD